MPADTSVPQTRHPGDGWVPFVWMCCTLAFAALLGTACLPGTSGSVYDSYTARDFIRGEWLLLGSLLAIPIYRAARAGWWSALLVGVIPGAQMLFIADSAIGAMRRVGMAETSDNVWYVVALTQVVMFASVALVGAMGDLADRRWVRMMRILTADHAPPAMVRPARPAPPR